MFKKVWFQVHWFIGITAGTVLMAIGISGAVLSFREELLDWINPGIVHVALQQTPALTPQQLIERLHAALPLERVVNLTVYSEPGASARINFAPPPGVRRGEQRLVDPYSGALLAPLAGSGFFEFTERFHRWLLLPIEYGKPVAGTLSLCMLILALSGLYLRWPRRALNWRAWLRLDFGLSGRSLLWNLHSVIGTWALVMYVIFASTGMYWAFDWFKSGVNALAGETTPMRDGPPSKRPEGKDKQARDTAQAPLDLSLAWQTFQSAAGPATLVNIRIPDKAGQPLQFNYLTADSPHERARNRMSIMAQSGVIKQNELFADKPRGSRFIGAIYSLHMGSYFGLPGRIGMTLAALILPLFGITGWMLYLDRRRKKRAIRTERALLDTSLADTDKDTVLVAYASQSGQAEGIALRYAGALQQAGLAVHVQSLAALEAPALSQFQRALFVASTFGEGEAPDGARRFVAQLSAQIAQAQTTLLGHLQYGLLALGDRRYNEFCGFGHRLNEGLRTLGARPLFPLIEVDNGNAAALGQWQQALRVLTAGQALTVQHAHAPYQPWALRKRSLLNAGSCGQAIFHLEFEPPVGIAADWQSGAQAELLPRHCAQDIDAFLERTGLPGHAWVQHDGSQRTLAEALSRSVLPSLTDATGTSPQQLADMLPTLDSRRYSIASTAADGRVHLLVRQVVHAGGLGLASGWLTAAMAVGDSVNMRLLDNQNFALVAGDAPAIFIGNGSGLAGLRGHLRARELQGCRRNWLLFGERQRAHDYLYQEEIRTWQENGMLSRVDLAFSRDQAERIYVQEKLRLAATQLKDWLADGAVLYVCGSLNGMAAGVDAALTDIIGSAALQELNAQGRYRRDVY